MGEVSFRMDRWRIKRDLVLLAPFSVIAVWLIAGTTPHGPLGAIWRLLLALSLVATSLVAIPRLVGLLVKHTPAVTMSDQRIEVNTGLATSLRGRRRSAEWSDIIGASVVRSLRGELLVLKMRGSERDVVVHLCWMESMDQYGFREAIGSRLNTRL